MLPPRLKPQDSAELRQFGLGFAALFTLFFYGILPWWFERERQLFPLFVSVAVALLALLWPRAIYPFYRVWMVIAGVLAWINTRVILGLAFFLLLTPLGFLLFRRGRTAFKAGFDPSVASYRHDLKPEPATQMEHPF